MTEECSWMNSGWLCRRAGVKVLRAVACFVSVTVTLFVKGTDESSVSARVSQFSHVPPLRKIPLITV